MEKNKIGLIVATHGTLGQALVEAAEMIVGQKTGLTPFAFLDEEPPKESFRRLQALIKKSNQGDGVILLVDLFGGTPGTLALSMLQDDMLEVATGVNLPMAVTAATLEPGLTLRNASAAIVAAGRKSIKEAGSLLKG